MEDTLESIRPSNSQAVKSQLSFLYGRDPSILAYGQVVAPFTDSKKNLMSMFQDEELDSSLHSSVGSCVSLANDTIKVYLRMKPFPPKLKLNKQQQEAYQILNSTTLLTKLPNMDSNTSSLRRPSRSDIISRKFTFTHTFGPETTQLQLFEQAIKQQMTEFLTGRSATVMSYGTTNAGKSFTLQGTTKSPGIIPRGLEFVFNNINPRSTPCYKPLYNTDVVSLDASDRAYEMELKTKLLSFGSTDKNQYVQAYKAMQQLLQDESPLKPNDTSDANYSVWVSFAEIYNETIYDLLFNDCHKKRSPLKLATDSNGKAFIKGLKMVCVNSSSEAYQLLMAGQYNLKVAATALNARSSRSHCIFTIKLLKYYRENSPADVEVSTFSFCDLAGSERLKKTLNAGDRLKEAQNINTSLLVLGRCLKSIFEVQSAKLKHEVVGPFRESKLTRLFQSALSGKEHIALVVNVNPVPNLYVETQNVLNFSAIAKQIVVEPVICIKKRTSTSRFSQIVSQSVKTVTDWDVTELKSIRESASSLNIEKVEYVYAEEYDDVVKENEKLKKEITDLKIAALNIDFEIRREMSSTYAAMIKNLETNFKNRLQDVEEQQENMLEWSVKQVEDYYKKKLSHFSSRKRTRVSDSDGEFDEEMNLEELEAENIQLTAKVESLKQVVEELRVSKEKLIIQNNQNTFELSLAKKDLENCKNLLLAAQNDIDCDGKAKGVIEELKKQLSAREDQIKILKEYLNEAKEEWIKITEVESQLEEMLKKKEEQLLESFEKITDLTEQIERTNICLAESTEMVEKLEDELDQYAKKLTDTEKNLQDAKDKLEKAIANNMVLSKEKEELENMLANEITANKNEADSRNEKELVLELEQRNKQLCCELQELKDQLTTKDEMLNMLNTKLSVNETENTTLMNKLTQSSNCTKVLREELNSTKIKLCDITEKLNNLIVLESIKVETVDADCNTSFVSITETIEIKKEHNDEDRSAPTTIEDDNKLNSDTFSSGKLNCTVADEEKNHKMNSEKLEQLIPEYKDLRSRYLNETLKVKMLTKELDETREELSHKTSNEVNEQMITDYKNSLKSVQDELLISAKEWDETVKELGETLQEKEALENELLEYKSMVEKLQNDLKESQNKETEISKVLEMNSKECAAIKFQLSDSLDKLQKTTEKCVSEHINHIDKLEKDIAAADERNMIKEQLLDAHIQRISKLEKDLVEAVDLEKKVILLQDQIKICEEEKTNLQKQLDENVEKLSSFENQLQESISREQEKENEIVSLQKEMKSMIQTNSDNSKMDMQMEKEVKNTLRELKVTQEALDESKKAYKNLERTSQEKIDKLEIRVKAFEENALYLAVLQEGAQKRQTENEQLRTKNNELREKIEHQEREMESFKKNRDDAMQRYESLVKQLHDDAERNKREVARYAELFLKQSTPTPRKEEIRTLKDELRNKTSLLEQMQIQLKKFESLREKKETIINTSDDEFTPQKIRSTQRRGRKNIANPPSDISVVELSGSESKRVTRRTALPPPSQPSVEKRKTRVKKRLVQPDENCMDITPTETSPKYILRSPLSVTRSLRNRKK